MSSLIKERLSLAYIGAVCARAGLELFETKMDVDSVDGFISSKSGNHPILGFQAKSTSRAALGETTLKFDLPVKNYDDLRKERTGVVILIVVCLPANADDWLVQDEVQLSLRRAGYWLSLRGMPGSDNQSSVRVEIPRAQVFEVSAVTRIMAAIGPGPGAAL